MTRNIRNTNWHKAFVVALCFALFLLFTVDGKIHINIEATTIRREESGWVKCFSTLKHCNYGHGRGAWNKDIFWSIIPLFPGRDDYPEWLFLSLYDTWAGLVYHFIINRSAE